MDLDAKFGECRAPQRPVSNAELFYQPSSLQILSAANRSALVAYMESADTLKLPRVVHATAPVLWLVDIDGNVRFAMEEVINLAGDVIYVLPKNGPPMRPDENRIGHPGLLDPAISAEDKTARIGGEILYDPIDGFEPNWVLTNNSGRYGKSPETTVAQLEAASLLFAQFGVFLRTFFYYYR